MKAIRVLLKRRVKANLSRSIVPCIFLVSTVLVFGSTPFDNSLWAQQAAKSSGPVSWRMTCGTEGGLAYGISGGLSKFIKDNVKNVQILPEPGGTVEGVHLISRGEVIATYGNPSLLEDAYKNTGPFEKKPVGKIKPLHTIYFYPVTMFMIARADKGIQSMDDLAGRKISLGIPAVGLTISSVEVFKALGLWEKVENKWISMADLADSLKAGVVDAVMGWNVADFSAGSAVKEIDLYAKCRVLTISKKQQEIINNLKGFVFRFTPAESVFTQDVGTKQLPGWALWYGFHWASNADPDRVYDIVKAFFEKSQELSKISKSLAVFAQDPKQATIAGISSAPDVPVHPGAARYYKEKGFWQEKWKVGEGAK